MAVKQRKRKKNYIKELYKKAVKIRCFRCDDKESCPYRKNKEKSEQMGIVTYCTMTPNKKKRKVKK